MLKRRKIVVDGEDAVVPRPRRRLKRLLVQAMIASLAVVGTVTLVDSPAQAYSAPCWVGWGNYCESANVLPDSAHRVYFQIFTDDIWCGGTVYFEVVDRGNYVVVQSGTVPDNVSYWGWPIYGLYSPQGYFLRMYTLSCYNAYGEVYN